MLSRERRGRDDIRAILQSALEAVTPQIIMRTRVNLADRTLFAADGGTHVAIELDSFDAIRLLAIGKAAPGLAAQAEPWGPFAETLAVCPEGTPPLTGIEVMHGPHPKPSRESVAAGERVLALVQATRANDLLIALISGGASAMVEVPAVPLADLERTTDLLLGSGAPIDAVNTVRKHLSELKGGNLARAARGRVLVLYVSDVPGNDPGTVASGPFAPDASTFHDARAVLERFGLIEAVPPSVRERVEAGVHGKIAETPKPGDPVFAGVTHIRLATNETALEAAAARAGELGYRVERLPTALRGEARLVGDELATRARLSPPQTCIIAGGETTVHVIGAGKGGRNQEVALACVPVVSGTPIIVAAIGTDGVDGPTDAAGAIVDGMTLARAEALKLDVAASLAENDSYAFFFPLGDLIKTGPTGTNVMDLFVALHVE